MTDTTKSLASFLSAVAAKQPTPGGGAVSAAAGALAAAMGEMVLNYSVGKKGLEAHQAELGDALHQVSKARELMLELIVEDQLAFEALTASKKDGDGARTDAALLTAIRIPQTISATAHAILEQAARVAQMANRWLLSDLAVCAELAMATIRCGSYNVRVNLADVSDVAERQRLGAWCDDIVSRSSRIMRDLMPAIWNRIGS